LYSGCADFGICANCAEVRTAGKRNRSALRRPAPSVIALALTVLGAEFNSRTGTCSRGRGAGCRLVAGAPMTTARWLLCAFAVAAFGCSIGPQTLPTDRIRYNEAVKTSTEEQLLLNIVRLRYTDTPSSLGVSSLAEQYELTRNLGLTP